MKQLSIILLIAAVTSVLCSFLIPDKTWSGVCLGLGVGLACFACSKLVTHHYFSKHPEVKKQAEIMEKDERNEMLRSKAKAKSADFIQWFVLALAWITIIVGFPVWLTLALVGIFILKTVLEYAYLHKYDHEL